MERSEMDLHLKHRGGRGMIAGSYRGDPQKLNFKVTTDPQVWEVGRDEFKPHDSTALGNASGTWFTPVPQTPYSGIESTAISLGFSRL